MCDPVSLIVGVVGGAVASKAMAPKSAPAAATATAVDPAVERAQAEAEAAQKANARLANDQRRRREQGSLVSRGAPTYTLGDSPDAANPGSPITGPSAGLTTRSTVAKRGSLISQGGPMVVDGGGGGGFSRGGGGRYSGAIV